jgi:hypothetical protein
MLVYGDHEPTESPDTARRAALQACRGVAAEPIGLDRHAALVSAFIATSELAQGVADAEYRIRGCDAVAPAERAGLTALMLLAGEIERSWRSGFRVGAPVPRAVADRIAQCEHALPLRLRQAEGFAHYALYPESYLAAAAASGLGPRTRVIGLRSIGTGLAALVAAALRSGPPATLRPVGDPFRREIAMDPLLAADLQSDTGADFAIVDEGPGLSGSSFGAVVDWLEANGVASGYLVHRR